MKTWNVPVVEELDVTMTASGCLKSGKEYCWDFIHNGQEEQDKPSTYDPS